MRSKAICATWHVYKRVGRYKGRNLTQNSNVLLSYTDQKCSQSGPPITHPVIRMGRTQAPTSEAKLLPALPRIR